MTRFYVPCPSCRLPIRGRSHGADLDTHRVEFDAELFRGDNEPDIVVTVDPNVPARYEATQMLDGLGSAPTMTLLWLIGDEQANNFFMYLSRGRQAAEDLWPKVRLIYEYYLEEDWGRFNKSCQALFDESWKIPTTTHERATVAHHALGVTLKAIVDDEHPASATFLSRWLWKHTAALDHGSYVDFARADVENLTTLQRRVFDVVDLFVQRFDSWQIGVLRRLIPDENLPQLDNLRLFRDEFDILRDLYQQAFEVIAKTLRYPVAAQNSVLRDDPNSFGTKIPETLTRKTNPASLTAFDRLSNFEKLQYVAQVPGWNAWASLLDNKTRNAIGHGTVRHDLRSGLVISDNVPDGVPYLDVVADVYGIFDALCISIQVLRALRIASSPDLTAQSDALHAAVLAALKSGATTQTNY
jgi:hypothetical protein